MAHLDWIEFSQLASILYRNTLDQSGLISATRCALCDTVSETVIRVFYLPAPQNLSVLLVVFADVDKHSAFRLAHRDATETPTNLVEMKGKKEEKLN